MQLNGRNGLEARLECAWMARATISLPVPLSPVIRTLALVLAIRFASAMVSRM